MKHLLILILICIVSTAKAQDTIRIYFEYGSAKVSDSEARKIRALHAGYDLNDVEFAQFIGYADSTGDFNANLELSKKRANNVLKYCKNDFSIKTETNILAKGEGTNQIQTENRRVDIILHYPTIIETPKTEIIEKVDPRCFYIDTDALKYCNIREIKKRGRRFVYIEALPVDLFKERKHYYVIRRAGAVGKVAIQRVRWKLKTTGKLWWRKKRWVATIPRLHLLQYQFFTLKDAPCEGCDEEIFTKDTIILNTEKSYPDLFLADMMQVKARVFKRDEIKIRVPKEYIDLKVEHTITSGEVVDPLPNKGRWTINWTTKDFGKKNQQYYFTTIRIEGDEIPYIMRSHPTTICKNAPIWGGGGWGSPMDCGFVGFKGWSLGLKGVLEPGVFYHNDTLTGYLTAGVAFTKFINLQLMAGVNTHKGFYGALSFRLPILSFSLNSLGGNGNWLNTNQIGPGGFSSPDIHLYTGLDTKTSFNEKYQSFFEGNLHLGFSIEPRIFGIYPEFYLQGGFANDFLDRINTKVYPYGQFGIRFYTKSLI